MQQRREEQKKVSIASCFEEIRKNKLVGKIGAFASSSKEWQQKLGNRDLDLSSLSFIQLILSFCGLFDVMVCSLLACCGVVVSLLVVVLRVRIRTTFSSRWDSNSVDLKRE